jgi:hypothetical protein
MNKAKVKPLDLGQYPSRLPGKPLAYAAEWVAGGLALIWVAAVMIYVATAPAQPQMAPFVIITIVGLVLPLALIFAVLVTLRSVRALRDEAARLQASVDAMRKAFIHGQNQIDPAIQPSVARKLDAIVEQTLQTQTAVVNMAAKVGQKPAEAGRFSGVIAPAQSEPRPEEPPLALDPAPQEAGAPLPVEDFIRAMNFPDGPDDHAGFAAMRAALGHRDIAKLIRAAQDVLTLLSQDGIYMDDLKHDPAAPAPWRAFAQGQRGRAVATLGGVRDRSALALSTGRLRNDPVFRDAAHHFLRAFDRCLVEFEPNADDDDLAALAGTRTARAFMLLGRVMGTFD